MTPTPVEYTFVTKPGNAKYDQTSRSWPAFQIQKNGYLLYYTMIIHSETL